VTLFDELKRRRVFRAIVGYGIVAFALLQVVEPITHGFHLPDETLTITVVALGFGFPVVVVLLAWAFDITASGIERAPSASASRLARLRLAFMLIGIGLIAAAPGLTWYFFVHQARRAAQSAGATTPSIAVLPFADLSPSKDQEYFSDGIAEEILNALNHVEGLHVAGRTSAFSFKGKNEDLRTIGERLKVGAVLEGSVRKEGSRVRITTQLISTADGYHLWSETFDRELTGIFAVQDEIARAVVEALKVKLLPGKKADAQQHRAANLEVYRQYLLGRQFFERNSEDGFRRAVEAYQKALAVDSTYAPAWAGLAVAAFSLGDVFGGTSAAISEAHRRAVEAADRAVALGPDLAEAYDSRATIRYYVAWDWTGAQADLERALALSPGDAANRKDYAEVLATLGRLRGAIAEDRKAVEMDPLSGRIWNSLGRFYNGSSQPDLARGALERALEIIPGSFSSPYHLATSYLVDRQPEAALAALQRYRVEGPVWELGIAMVEHDLGHREKSQQLLDAAIGKYGHVSAFQIAEVYAWRGEQDRAFKWLERAYAQRDGGVTLVKYSPLLRSLRGDPRYPAFLRKLNLPPD